MHLVKTFPSVWLIWPSPALPRKHFSAYFQHEQWQIAADLKKPVLLHTKGQEKRIAELLRGFPYHICVHWYSGTEQDLEPYLTPVPGRNIHLLSAKQVKGAYHLPLNRIIQLISSLKTYFDLVLIDTDMASTDASAKLMEMSYLALLITDDTECSIKNNQRFRRLLTQKQVSYDHMHVIVNQIRKEQRMYSDQEIEELLHIPVLVTLPYYDQVWKYNNSYLSLYEDPVSPLQPSLSSLVDRLSKLLEK